MDRWIGQRGGYIDRWTDGHNVLPTSVLLLKAKVSWEVVDSRAEARNIQDKPGASCSARKEESDQGVP